MAVISSAGSIPASKVPAETQQARWGRNILATHGPAGRCHLAEMRCKVSARSGDRHAQQWPTTLTIAATLYGRASRLSAQRAVRDAGVSVRSQALRREPQYVLPEGRQSWLRTTLPASQTPAVSPNQGDPPSTAQSSLSI